MEITVNIKTAGTRYGTSRWLKEQITSGKIWFEETNDYYIPVWDKDCSIPGALTHGLIIKDKDHSALVAYRDCDGDYIYNVECALGCGIDAHWRANFTDATIKIIEEICDKWIDSVTESVPKESIEFCVVIKK